MLYHLLERMEECREDLKATFQRRDSRTVTGCPGQARMEETGEAIAELHTGVGADGRPQPPLLLYYTVAVAMHRVLSLLTCKVTL